MSNFRPFSPAQLELLEQVVRPELRAWAIDAGLVAGSEPAIRRLAAFAARKAGNGGYSDEKTFKDAVRSGFPLNTQRTDLGLKAPIEFAGLAAGRMASARLLTAWYDLRPEDFLIDQGIDTGDQRSESLDRAVGSTPKDLGFVAVSTHDVLVQTIFVAQDAVTLGGPAALELFMELPQYPRPDWAL